MPNSFSALYPAIKVSVVMPNAQFQDGRAPEVSVDLKRSMVGDTFTYIKTSPRKTLTLAYRITKMKAMELQAFVKIYYRADWQIRLHDNTIWVGNLTANPFIGKTSERAGGQPGGELLDFSLSFSAIQVQ